MSNADIRKPKMNSFTNFWQNSEPESLIKKMQTSRIYDKTATPEDYKFDTKKSSELWVEPKQG